MRSLKIRRVLLWVLPIMFGGVFLFFFIGGWQVQSIDQSYEEARQALGWTTLEEYAECSNILSEIILDNLGRIWVECKTARLFDGSKWLDIGPAAPGENSVFDLAVDQKGQAWEILSYSFHKDDPNFVYVYDGQEWKTFTHQDLGISNEWHLSDVETDSKGRVWVGTYNSTQDERGFLRLENNNWRLISSRAFNYLYGFIKSDNVGRIWMMGDHGNGLYVFDGGNFEEFLYNGERIIAISAIAFDNQNHLWVATRCGAVREYSNNTRKTYQEESPPNSICKKEVRGIYLDNQERIWIWGSDSELDAFYYVSFFDGGAWKTLTRENSGLARSDVSGREGQINGLVVDNLDRVWILNEGGISMIPVKDIQIIPEAVLEERKQALSWNAFLYNIICLTPFVFALLWFIVLLNLHIWPTVLLIFLVGGLLPGLTADTFENGINIMLGEFPIISGLLGGIIGGEIGRSIGKKSPQSSKWESLWGMLFGILFIVPGLILGFIFAGLAQI